MTALKPGLRVRVKGTMLYNGRVGVLQPNSGEPDDQWDFNLRLDAQDPPVGISRIEAKLYEERTIGVSRYQVVPLSE